MPLHAAKKGVRAFGVAESFRPGSSRSTLAGVVMRTDLVVDGFALGRSTVGGDDATAAILRMFRMLRREDVNLVILSGCVISRYNIVDVDGLSRGCGVPVLCLTYNESRGLEDAIRRNFAHPEERLERYRALGARKAVSLGSGHRVLVRCSGLGERETKEILNAFTLQGGIPEPVRVARLLARAASARSARPT